MKSLAIFALLSTSHATKLRQHSSNGDVDYDPEYAAVKDADRNDIVTPEKPSFVDTEGMINPAVIKVTDPILMETDSDIFSKVHTDVDVNYEPKGGCWSGIDRFNDPSNSLENFEKHKDSG